MGLFHPTTVSLSTRVTLTIVQMLHLAVGIVLRDLR